MKNNNTTRMLLGISLAAVMVLGSVHLGFSEPLRVQLEKEVAPDQIRCDNESHVLVLRTNGNYVCVYEKTAEKLGWNLFLFSMNETLKEFPVEWSDEYVEEKTSKVSRSAPSEGDRVEGYILLDEPFLNQVSNIELGLSAHLSIKEQLDELMPLIIQYANENPDELQENFTYEIVYSTSLNLLLTDSTDYEVSVEEKDDRFSIATITFPVILEKDYLTEDKTITGTIQPTEIGYAEISFEYLDEKYLFVDENETVELFWNTHSIDFADPSREFYIHPTVQETHSAVYSELTDAQKQMLSLGEDGTVDQVHDESIIDIFSDLIHEYETENQRLATIEDKPNEPSLIVSLAKAQEFTATIEAPDTVTNGEKFDLLVKIDSDNTGVYEQVYSEIFLGEGLGFAIPEKEPSILDSNPKTIIVVNPDIYTEELIESLDDVNIMFDPTYEGTYYDASTIEDEPVYKVLDNFYDSFKPDSSHIENTHSIQSVQSGEWDIVVVINDEIYRSTVTVEES